MTKEIVFDAAEKMNAAYESYEKLTQKQKDNKDTRFKVLSGSQKGKELVYGDIKKLEDTCQAAVQKLVNEQHQKNLAAKREQVLGHLSTRISPKAYNIVGEMFTPAARHAKMSLAPFKKVEEKAPVAQAVKA